MKRFEYKARDSKTGKMVKGAIQAENERTAGKLLIEQGFTPEKIEEEDDGGIFARFQNKIKNKDKNVFTRQFATLIGAGLPLSNSLRVVGEQTQSKPMRKLIDALLADVEAGRTLTQACQKYPDVFNNLYIALLRAGEASGTLDLSLVRLADQNEKDEQMMSDIRGALTYPAIILVVILAVLVFMVVVVVPQVEGLYNDLGKELPWATAFLVGISNFLVEQWYVVLIVTAVAIWFLIQFAKTDVGQRWLAIFKLNVPLFKGLFLRLYNSRFARTCQNLLSTGVSIQDSLRISGEAIGNIMVQEQIEIVMDKVKQGKPLSESMKERSYILPLIPQMASIGEQSGKIDEMLGKAALVYENELDEQIRTISKLIEPILMVVMALLVGFIVIAVLMPIYAIVSDVQGG
ncbi:type II secretion system F family protein [Candidatus Saccharibacteria bacterium]|nr:type II secretion system F family protein [Candidatus Saccharibacteria bacterium]